MTCTSGNRLNQVVGRHMVSHRDTWAGKAGPRNRHVTLAYVTSECCIEKEKRKKEKQWLEQRVKIRLAPLSNIYASRPRVLTSTGLL